MFDDKYTKRWALAHFWGFRESRRIGDISGRHECPIAYLDERIHMSVHENQGNGKSSNLTLRKQKPVIN
jgi:hypothetical protein